MNYKNTKLYKIAREAVYMTWIHPKELKNERQRKKGVLGEFESLKKYKGLHSGKRCFIVATGPSLTEEDYKKLEKEYTIGVNGLCMWFNGELSETNYFVISDDDVYDRVEIKLKALQESCVFISERVGLTQRIDSKFHVFPVDLWNRFVMKAEKKRLSNDISICSYDEETVVFHAIQIALYLGFTEIYLIGTDCNYKQKRKYAVDHGKQVDTNVGDKMIKSYHIVNKYQDKYKFKVYNATRGGMLEVFPRVNLDEILKGNNYENYRCNSGSL